MTKAMGPFRDSHALLGSPGPEPMYRLKPPLIGPVSGIFLFFGFFKTLWGNLIKIMYLLYNANRNVQNGRITFNRLVSFKMIWGQNWGHC